MVYPNEVLAQSILKSSFQLVLFTPQDGGGMVTQYFKIHKKDFYREIAGLDIPFKVVFVSDYPPSDLEPNTYYIKNNGKMVWFMRS